MIIGNNNNEVIYLKVKTNDLLKIVLSIIIIFLIFLLGKVVFPYFKVLIGILIPFMISFTFSFLLWPFINSLNKLKVPKKCAVIMVLGIFVILLVLFGVYLVPIIAKELTIFFSNLPIFIEEASKIINNIGVIKKLGIDFKQIINEFIINKSDFISNSLNFFYSIFSYIIPTITTPILIIYFTFYYEKIEEKIKKRCNNNYKIYMILKEIKYSMHQYFRSYFIITLTLSMISGLLFLLLKIEYYMIWGLLIGITNIIPYIGPYIGGGIVGLYVLSTTPNLLVYVIIIIVCLQVIESMFLTPKIQGDIMEINPILIIFFITLFGEFLGIFGMIIAVPTVRIIQIIIKYEKKDKKRYN